MEGYPYPVIGVSLSFLVFIVVRKRTAGPPEAAIQSSSTGEGRPTSTLRPPPGLPPQVPGPQGWPPAKLPGLPEANRDPSGRHPPHYGTLVPYAMAASCPDVGFVYTHTNLIFFAILAQALTASMEEVASTGVEAW